MSRRGPWVLAVRYPKGGKLHPTLANDHRTRADAEHARVAWTENMNRDKRRKPPEYVVVKLPAEVVRRLSELERHADALHAAEWLLRRQARALLDSAVAAVEDPW